MTTNNLKAKLISNINTNKMEDELNQFLSSKKSIKQLLFHDNGQRMSAIIIYSNPAKVAKSKIINN